MTWHLEHLAEPELEFGAEQRAVDIRFGLASYGPLDGHQDTAPKSINVGIVGTAETVDGIARWLERCQSEIPGKPTRQPYLFPGFPGYQVAFHGTFNLDARLQRTISARELDAVLKEHPAGSQALVNATVELFLSEIDSLDQPVPQVTICAIPWSILKATEGIADDEAEEEEEDSEDGGWDFHDLLKARALQARRTIQLVLPSTYDERERRPQKTRRDRFRDTQDEATRAWNFLTALYYKAGGSPWRLVYDRRELTTCYVGVSFYRSLDGQEMYTSTAQVFNERGDGIIVRGGAAHYHQKDRQVHLTSDAAQSLMARSLARYRREHATPPARVVVYKTSSFDDAEREGFRAATQEERISVTELISLRRSDIEFFRSGAYPTLRGTCLYLPNKATVMYTRGSVPFFATYPGLYVPRALACDFRDTEGSAKTLAAELLALTKMNWNNTQFDGAYPICIRAARQVGKILKYIAADKEIEQRYSYYM